MTQTDIPGYTYRTDAVPRSLVTEELELLKATLPLGDDDLAALRRSADLLALEGRGGPRRLVRLRRRQPPPAGRLQQRRRAGRTA